MKGGFTNGKENLYIRFKFLPFRVYLQIPILRLLTINYWKCTCFVSDLCKGLSEQRKTC